MLFPPLQPAKRILNAPDGRPLTHDGSFSFPFFFFLRLVGLWYWCTEPPVPIFTFIFRTPTFFFALCKVHRLNLDGSHFPLPSATVAAAAHSSRARLRTCTQMPPPEIQPGHHCHSDKWIVTGKAYQCQRQAAPGDFDSALFPQLNRRLCFAKQTQQTREPEECDERVNNTAR